MSVLVAILKIIGIILLAVIGLILLLLLAVLFVPVRYRVDGEYEKNLRVEAKAGWLFHLIYFHFSMLNMEKEGILRIAGIPVLRIPIVEKTKKPKSSRRKRKKSGKSVKSVKKEKTGTRQVHQEASAEEERIEKTENGSEKKIDKKFENKMLRDDSPVIYEYDHAGKKRKKFFPFERIRKFFHEIKQWFLHLLERIKLALSKIQDIKSVWLDENNKKSTGLVLTEMKYLLLHYGPTKIRAEVQFSAGDPALTGQILGGLSMIPFLYRKKVQILPDFVSEEVYLNGHGTARGHIRMFRLLYSLYHLWKDENVKNWIKENR